MVKSSILFEIIEDHAPKSQTLLRVGLVGSYARETATAKSDIDLVFDTGGKLIDEAILSAGVGIRSVLINQFNIKTDIVNYDTILRRTSENNSPDIVKQGYENMLNDVKWIWRKS